MPNRSKQKGDRAERAIVDLLRSHGLDAYRIPLSGSCNGFKADVELRLRNETIKLESKVRASGFTRLYKWLDYAKATIVKADRQPALIVLRLDDFAKLLASAQADNETLASDHPIWGDLHPTD